MSQGISPTLFNQDNAGIPLNFEIREFIEVWPLPDKPYEVHIKGHMGLRPFEFDTDIPSIDSQPLFLMALADAKSHYRHPDSRKYDSQVEALIRTLNSGTYGDERIVPNGGDPEPSPLSYPQVTFSRP